MSNITVLLADDHQIVRDGIKSLLKDAEDIEVVSEATNGNEVLQYLENRPFDVVLMDVTMPGKNGIETTEEIKKRFSKTKVLALTMHEESQYIRKMIDAGASGYILKNTGRQELVNAVKLVASGKNYFSHEVSSKLIMGKLSGDEGSENIQLTKREIEVLRLISEEMTNNEIAEKLFISIRTVDTHRRNLLQKLGVKNTAGLVKYAIKNNLLD